MFLFKPNETNKNDTDAAAADTTTNAADGSSMEQQQFPIIVDRKLIFQNEEESHHQRNLSFDPKDIDLSVLDDMKDDVPVVVAEDTFLEPSPAQESDLDFFPGLKVIGEALLSQEEIAFPEDDKPVAPEEAEYDRKIASFLKKLLAGLALTAVVIVGCLIYGSRVFSSSLFEEKVLAVQEEEISVEEPAAWLVTSLQQVYEAWSEEAPAQAVKTFSLLPNTLEQWTQSATEVKQSTSSPFSVSYSIMWILVGLYAMSLVPDQPMMDKKKAIKKVTDEVCDASPIIDFLSSFAKSGKGRASPSCKASRVGKFSISAYKDLTVHEIDCCLKIFGKELSGSKMEKIAELIKTYEKILLALPCGDILKILKARKLPVCTMNAPKAAMIKLLIESGF